MEFFLSTNDGLSWNTVSDGLEDLRVQSLAVKGAYLFAGTLGGHVYRRPLSEMIAPSAVAQNTQPEKSSVQAYPNPFSEKTSVHFRMAERGPAQVTIVNLLGQQVVRLFDGELDAGEHSFEWNASGAGEGTYFCVIRADGRTEQTAIVLTR